MMSTDNTEALLPCPFCGHAEPSFERMGTPRQSCIVVCGSCGCRHESSDEGADCGKSWNDRAAIAQCQQESNEEIRQLSELVKSLDEKLSEYEASAPSAQAEPHGLASNMRPKDGGKRFRPDALYGRIDDEDFIFDASLIIFGDFSDEDRRRYVQWISDTLNAADEKLPRNISKKEGSA